MPRPSPLRNIGAASAIADPYDSIALTPRTPHSRSGRAEEGFTPAELRQIREEYDQDERGQSSAAPLLSSNLRTKGLKRIAPAARAPIVFWSAISSFLLFCTIVSFQYPGTLEWYLGVANVLPSLQHHPSSIDSPLLISYENYTKFPLSSKEYLSQCYKMTGGKMSMKGYWDLPQDGMIMDTEHAEDDAVCSSTITYMLDGERGLVADLALISQAAALARERNRTFLIDDTYWNRGRWTDHFQSVRETQPGPEPGCTPPPPEEYVACPRHARHWIITSRTAKFHFGPMYVQAYEDPYKHNTNRAKPLYDMAAKSLASTISPSAESQKLIDLARRELPTDGPYDAAHIRRGDMTAQVWKHRNGYIPLEAFSDALSETNPLTKHVFLASDSPSSLATLAATLEHEHGKTVFYLRRSVEPSLRVLASPQSYNQTEFADYDAESRVRLTKGMVVDFALLSGAWLASGTGPDYVVCTIGSAACKLSAVALGWDKAFGSMDPTGDGRIVKDNMKWVEMDLQRTVIPQWQAYDTF